MGAIFCDGKQIGWLKDLLNEVLVERDGVRVVYDKVQKVSTPLSVQQLKLVVCYPSHRGRTLTMARFLLPRQGCVMYWQPKGIQEILKPHLGQGADRYNDWIRKEFDSWNGLFKTMIQDDSEGLCASFIPSRDSFIAKRRFAARKSKSTTPIDEGINARDHLEEYCMSTTVVLWWLLQIGEKRQAVGDAALDVMIWLFDLAFGTGEFVCVLDADAPASPGDCAPQNFTGSATSFLLDVKGTHVMSLEPLFAKYKWAGKAVQRHGKC